MTQLTSSKTATSADNSSNAEVTGLSGEHSEYTVTIWSVDSNGDINTPAAGTGALEIQIPDSPGYEIAYDTDGTTAISVNFNTLASQPVTKKITGFPVTGIRVVPSSLSAGSRVKMLVRYDA